MIRNRLTRERDREALIRRSRRRGREGGFFPIWALTAPDASVYDPAVLPLTLWLRASFSASPWVGTASAGNSGTHDVTEATNPPTAGSGGTLVNALAPAIFDGTNDILVGTTTSTYLSVSAYTHVALIKVSSVIATTPGSPQVDDQVFADQASWAGLRVFDASGTIKASGWHYDTGYKSPTGLTVGTAWAMVSTTFNGSTISTDVNNSGAPSTVTAANAGGLSGTFTMGRSQSGSFPAFSILELMAAQSVISGANLSNIKSYFNSRYALSI